MAEEKSLKATEENKIYVECECGARVYGKSKVHAKSLLPAHKTSRLHKQIMEIKKRNEKCSQKKK